MAAGALAAVGIVSRCGRTQTLAWADVAEHRH